MAESIIPDELTVRPGRGDLKRRRKRHPYADGKTFKKSASGW